jgi:hypothetical protein
MAFLRPLFQLGMLFLLTSLMCLVLVNLLPASPLCGVGVLCIGTIAVILTVDAL